MLLHSHLFFKFGALKVLWNFYNSTTPLCSSYLRILYVAPHVLVRLEWKEKCQSIESIASSVDKVLTLDSVDLQVNERFFLWHALSKCKVVKVV